MTERILASVMWNMLAWDISRRDEDKAFRELIRLPGSARSIGSMNP